MHQAVQYQVEKLDWDDCKAYVRRVNVDYYTDADMNVEVKIIDVYERDLENDFTAIFYYYGYIGFGLYILFILYFAYIGIKTMILKPIKVVSPKFIILTFTIHVSIPTCKLLIR